MLAYARLMFGRGRGGAGMDTQAVTSQSSGSAAHATRRIGYIQAGAGFGTAIGSIDDGTSDLYAAAPILCLYWDENGGGGADSFNFCVSGVQLNAGWTQMVINGGTTLLRADANFSNVSDTIWNWPATGNLFVGGVNTVVFS